MRIFNNFSNINEATNIFDSGFEKRGNAEETFNVYLSNMTKITLSKEEALELANKINKHIKPVKGE